MELVGALYIVNLALCTLGVNAILKKVRPKRNTFPTCLRCKQPMVQLQHLGKEMPYEIKHYLSKHNLPKHVVRRFICPRNHRELWIAPPVAFQKKSVMVSHKL